MQSGGSILYTYHKLCKEFYYTLLYMTYSLQFSFYVIMITYILSILFTYRSFFNMFAYVSVNKVSLITIYT